MITREKHDKSYFLFYRKAILKFHTLPINSVLPKLFFYLISFNFDWFLLDTFASRIFKKYIFDHFLKFIQNFMMVSLNLKGHLK